MIKHIFYHKHIKNVCVVITTNDIESAKDYLISTVRHVTNWYYIENGKNIDVIS